MLDTFIFNCWASACSGNNSSDFVTEWYADWRSPIWKFFKKNLMIFWMLIWLIFVIYYSRTSIITFVTLKSLTFSHIYSYPIDTRCFKLTFKTFYLVHSYSTQVIPQYAKMCSKFIHWPSHKNAQTRVIRSIFLRNAHSCLVNQVSKKFVPSSSRTQII